MHQDERRWVATISWSSLSVEAQRGSVDVLRIEFDYFGLFFKNGGFLD